MKNKKKRIFITGGHFTPALAVIKELQNRGYRDFVWIGRKRTMSGDKEYSAEYRVVHGDLNIPFVDLKAGKIVRFNDIGSFFASVINLCKLPIGFFHSLIILLKYKPSIIISFGGFLAVPTVISGWSLRIPSVTHEQTVVSGFANKVIAKFSKKVLVSWKDSKKYFNKLKVVHTGNPIREEVFKITTNNFQINEKLPTIYITGGNQGAHIINKNIESIVESLLKKYNVIHQTGVTTITRDFERSDRLAKYFSGKTKGVYIVRGNIFGAEIGEVFDKADLVVSRSGANISTEILALGKMAILIPIPWSLNNEQLKNAKMLQKIGIATVLEQKDLVSEKLFENIESGIKNMERGKDFRGNSLKSSIKKAKSLIKIDSAKKIVNVIIKILKK